MESFNQSIAVAPRLLITLDHISDFKILCQQIECSLIDAKTISTSYLRHFSQLEMLLDNYVFVINNAPQNLSEIAEDMGYGYVHLTNTSDEQIQVVKKIIQGLPKSDADLYFTNPEIILQYYTLLNKVREIFNDNNIPFWLEGGALLGAVRNQGMIPWDTDIDIAMRQEDQYKLEELAKHLPKYGLELSYFDGVYSIYYQEGPYLQQNKESKFHLPNYRIYNQDGQQINVDYQSTHGIWLWKWPLIDINPYVLKENLYRMPGEYEYIYPNFYFTPDQLSLPQSTIKFGPYIMPCPHNPLSYLQRGYGEDCLLVGYQYQDIRTLTNLRKF